MQSNDFESGIDPLRLHRSIGDYPGAAPEREGAQHGGLGGPMRGPNTSQPLPILPHRQPPHIHLPHRPSLRLLLHLPPLPPQIPNPPLPPPHQILLPSNPTPHQQSPLCPSLLPIPIPHHLPKRASRQQQIAATTTTLSSSQPSSSGLEEKEKAQ